MSETRYGILQVPESHCGSQRSPFHVFHEQKNDCFMVVPAPPEIDVETFIEAGEPDFTLEFIVTIWAKDEAEAQKRKDEIEAWHRLDGATGPSYH